MKSRSRHDVKPVLSAERRQAFFLDVSSRSLLLMKGADVKDLLHRISTNDLNRLTASHPVQTILTNEKGRIIDIITVVNCPDGSFLLVGQTNDSERLAAWLNKFIIMEDARIEKPAFRHFLAWLLTPPLEKDLSNHIVFRESWGDVELSHVIVDEAAGDRVRQELLNRELTEIDASAYDKFRIIHGIPAYPNDLSLDVNPLEAGLRNLISWSKGCYIGQEVIARLDTYKKVQRRLVRLESEVFSGSLPAVLTDGHEEVGVVTSFWGREGGAGKGLGYVKSSVPDNAVLLLKDTHDQKFRIIPS